MTTASRPLILSTVFLAVVTSTGGSMQPAGGFAVRIASNLSKDALDGRLLLLVSKDAAREPRFQVNATSLSSAQVFGIDVEGLKAGDDGCSTPRVLGYPLESLSRASARQLHRAGAPAQVRDVPPCRRPHREAADGPRRRPAVEQRAGQPLQHAADDATGTAGAAALSASRSTRSSRRCPIRPTRSTSSTCASRASGSRSSGAATCSSARTSCCPRVRRAPERALSARHLPRPLSQRPRRTGARRRPTRTCKREYSERFHLDCYNRIQQQAAYQFYKDWTGPDFPRVLVIEIQHANPYYDDSYAVNSANLGPYGDAIMNELMPVHREAVPRHRRRAGRASRTAARRAAGKRWPCRCSIPTTTTAPGPPARIRSTSAPTPSSTSTRTRTPTGRRARSCKVPRPGHRNYLGHVSATLEQMNRLELVLGTQDAQRPAVGHLGGGLLAAGAGRLSEADLGQAHRRDRPEGRRVLEGALRPRPASCGATGTRGLGTKLEGKLHIYVGDMDNYYLNNAVYLVEDFLKSTTDPAVRRRGGLRRPRRALLERRSHARQRVLAPALPPDVHPEVRRARPEDRAGGRGPDDLAVLTSGSARDQADSPSTAGFSRPDWRPRRSSTAGCWRRSRSSCLRRPYTCRCER